MRYCISGLVLLVVCLTAACADDSDPSYNGNLRTSSKDSDGDGLTDEVESLLGTNPNDKDSDDDGNDDDKDCDTYNCDDPNNNQNDKQPFDVSQLIPLLGAGLTSAVTGRNLEQAYVAIDGTPIPSGQFSCAGLHSVTIWMEGGARRIAEICGDFIESNTNPKDIKETAVSLRWKAKQSSIKSGDGEPIKFDPRLYFGSAEQPAIFRMINKVTYPLCTTNNIDSYLTLVSKAGASSTEITWNRSGTIGENLCVADFAGAKNLWVRSTQ